MIAALLPLALQIADPELFTPPLGRTFTVELKQARSVAQVRKEFRSRRTVRFERDRNGLTAVLSVAPVVSVSGDDPFDRAMAALAGRTMRFRLGAGGRAIGLDGLDEHWARLVTTVAQLAPDGAGERFAAPLRAFPAAARLRFLATMLDPILPDPAPHPPGERPVTVDARSPAGAALRLTGRERVARRGDGTVQVAVDATGDDGKAAMTVTRRDVIDPATGLRLSHDERRRTVLVAGDGEALVIEERWSVTPR